MRDVNNPVAARRNAERNTERLSEKSYRVEKVRDGGINEGKDSSAEDYSEAH